MHKARARPLHPCCSGPRRFGLSARSMMAPREQNVALRPVIHEAVEPRLGCKCLSVLAHAVPCPASLRPRAQRPRATGFLQHEGRRAQATRRLACRREVFRAEAPLARPQCARGPQERDRDPCDGPDEKIVDPPRRRARERSSDRFVRPDSYLPSGQNPRGVRRVAVASKPCTTQAARNR